MNKKKMILAGLLLGLITFVNGVPVQKLQVSNKQLADLVKEKNQKMIQQNSMNLNDGSIQLSTLEDLQKLLKLSEKDKKMLAQSEQVIIGGEEEGSTGGEEAKEEAAAADEAPIEVPPELPAAVLPVLEPLAKASPNVPEELRAAVELHGKAAEAFVAGDAEALRAVHAAFPLPREEPKPLTELIRESESDTEAVRELKRKFLGLEAEPEAEAPAEE